MKIKLLIFSLAVLIGVYALRVDSAKAGSCFDAYVCIDQGFFDYECTVPGTVTSCNTEDGSHTCVPNAEGPSCPNGNHCWSGEACYPTPYATPPSYDYPYPTPYPYPYPYPTPYGYPTPA